MTRPAKTDRDYHDRLLSRVLMADNGCWEYQRDRDRAGYGLMYFHGAKRRTHRIMWALRNGDPGNWFVCHTCDNPPCVRPDHLWLGTNADNLADMAAKGRSRGGGPPGEAHGAAKLTATDVRLIRFQYAAGGVSQRELALRFGVCKTEIRKIIHFEKWKAVA